MDNLASQWLGYEFHAASLVGNSMKQSKCELELDLLEPTNLCTCVYMRDREIRLSVMVANFQRDEKKMDVVIHADWTNRELEQRLKQKDCFFDFWKCNDRTWRAETDIYWNKFREVRTQV